MIKLEKRTRRNVLLVVIVLLSLFACRVEKENQDPKLIQYPAPFYLRDAGCKDACFVGIQTERFRLINNTQGSWLLYDRLIDPHHANNLAGLDEYIFIQFDLNKQLQELLTKEENNSLPEENYSWGRIFRD